MGKLSNIINFKSSQANITNYQGKEKKKKGKRAFWKNKTPPVQHFEKWAFFFFETPHGFAIGQIPLGNMPSRYTKTILLSAFMYLYFWEKNINSTDNVSLELVYVGWDFGYHHSDNSKSISNYNSS